MPSLATLVALILAIVAIILLFVAIVALVRRRFFRSGTSLVVGLMLLATALIVGSVSIGTQGYRSFAREEVAATVTTRPLGEGRFEANFVLPQGQDLLKILPRSPISYRMSG